MLIDHRFSDRICCKSRRTSTPSTKKLSITTEENIAHDEGVGKNKTIIKEDISLRKAYEKHFLLSDGSYQVALYNEPIHKIENNQWVEVDNTLKLDNTRGNQYTTTNGIVDVSFARNYGNKLVTVRQDNYLISWGLSPVFTGLSEAKATLTPNMVQAEIVSTDLTSFSIEEQKTMAIKSSSTLQYRNALSQNVDLEYIVLPSKIKENIILQSKQDIAYYIVSVTTENLTARLLPNREIEFYNEYGEVVFTITSPYMYDSAGELSEEISVQLISKGNGCYDIQMTPDSRWLNSTERMYPVVLDPQISVSTVRSNIIDNYVLEGSGNQNQNLDRLYIGKKSGKTARAYIKYVTMPTLPTDAEITGATMTLTMLNGTSSAANASAYKVTGGDWESDTITWNNKPTLNALILANISHNNLTGYSFSCSGAVSGWYQDNNTGSRYNYGFMIRYYDETIEDYNSIYSADCSNESKRPSLIIYYSGTDGGSVFDTAENIALDASEKVQTTEANDEQYYKFIPSVSGEYLFYSNNASRNSDPYITIYSGSGEILANDDNSGGDKNFRLSVNLSRGSTYYIRARHSNISAIGSYYLNILILCKETADIGCRIRNVESNSYLDLDDHYYVYQHAYRRDTSAKWTIRSQSNGYFTIESAEYPGHYLGISGTSTGVDNICLYDSLTDHARWKIYVKSTGAMLIESKSAKGKVLYAADNYSEGSLQLINISYGDSNRHKWKIECQTETPLEGQQHGEWCWAASARMYTRYYYGEDSEMSTQSEIVSAMENMTYGYVGGTASDISHAIKLYTESINETPMQTEYSPYDSNRRIYTEEILKRFITDGHVLIITRVLYENGAPTEGHASLIVGYTTKFNNGTLQYHYTINDPMPNPQPNNFYVGIHETSGQVYSESYQWICTGQMALNNTHNDNYIWNGFVVATTDYSDSTYSPPGN